MKGITRKPTCRERPFRDWRWRMEYTQEDAAKALDLSVRTVRNLDQLEDWPDTRTRLACEQLEASRSHA